MVHDYAAADLYGRIRVDRSIAPAQPEKFWMSQTAL
jgi:hypothetical protein